MSEPRQTQLLEQYTERVTGAPKSINTDHAFIHQGIAFKATLDIGALNRTESNVYSMLTPANEYLHFKNFSLFGIGANLRVEIKRGTVANPMVVADPDGGGIGTELIGPHNVNDLSARTSGVLFGLTPTFTGAADGETWDVIIAPGSSTNQFRSTNKTSVSDNFEYVMKPGTYYTITITNTSAGADATGVGLEMFWYEEEDA